MMHQSKAAFRNIEINFQVKIKVKKIYMKLEV